MAHNNCISELEFDQPARSLEFFPKSSQPGTKLDANFKKTSQPGARNPPSPGRTAFALVGDPCYFDLTLTISQHMLLQSIVFRALKLVMHLF
jgi:hypothetical protein